MMLGRWLASGRSEAEFWRQTPATYTAVMRAEERVRQLAIEQQVALHHMSAQMRVMAGAGKLSPVDEWLKRVRPQPRRTVEDMILALQDAAAQGAPITFEKVEG